jgi:predicted acetyltransferase
MALDRPHLVMVPATLADYPALQNLARFYVYDMSRYCGDLPEWECPEDGLYEAYDFRSYFETPDCFPFSLYAGDERAGFLVVKNIGVGGTALWNMEQFFVTAKFQRRGQGARLAQEIWTRFRGLWRIEVIPENARALAFWQHLVDRQSAGSYRRERRPVATPEGDAERIVFTFES